MTAEHKIMCLCLFTFAVMSGPAGAEKADRQQVLRMSAKQAGAEGTRDANTKFLEGDVLITQGTMRITADKATVKETDGEVFAELYGSTSSQITFRQKREGNNDYIEASADRAEYDDKTGTLRLFSRVRFKSGNDQTDSEFMQYNSNTEQMSFRNQIPGAKPKGGSEEGRVIFEIQPRNQSNSRATDTKSAPSKKS
jgi:lipopolysaccharide export system protein LptA